MNDPNQGQWSFVHHVLGEVMSQTDARGITTTMTYDLKEAGVVQTTRGVSSFDNPESVVQNGFVPRRVDIESIPESLQVVRAGTDPRHFELTTRPGMEMTAEECVESCRGVK